MLNVVRPLILDYEGVVFGSKNLKISVACGKNVILIVHIKVILIYTLIAI